MPAGATYEPLATTTLTGTQSTIDFTSISGSYTDLVVSIYCQNAAATTGTRTGLLKLNSDSGTNYSYTSLNGDGATAASSRATSQSAGIYYAELPRNGNGANVFGFARISFFNYAGSTNKTILSENSADLNGSGNVVRIVGLWRSTSAITSISLIGGSEGFASGTRATLYGIARA
jgi:hypothetical protein